jgi:hypothetical protein
MNKFILNPPLAWMNTFITNTSCDGKMQINANYLLNLQVDPVFASFFGRVLSPESFTIQGQGMGVGGIHANSSIMDEGALVHSKLRNINSPSCHFFSSIIEP